jgi:hypothetical protein
MCSTGRTFFPDAFWLRCAQREHDVSRPGTRDEGRSMQLRTQSAKNSPQSKVHWYLCGTFTT